MAADLSAICERPSSRKALAAVRAEIYAGHLAKPAYILASTIGGANRG